jgi:hypothetical protein
VRETLPLVERSSWWTTEVTVPFSLGSYLLGVGTVVGALAFGFGSGALLTSTPMKETAAAPTRTERVARAEPKPPAQQEKPAAPQEKPPAQQDTRANPAPPAEPAAVAAHPDPVSSAQAAAPRPEARREAESAKQSKPAAKQPAPEKQASSAKPGEPANREPANQTEQKEAVQKKAAERKGDRQKRYTDYTERQDTERNARSSFAGSRTRQPPSEQQNQPERTGFAVGRQEPHFDRFQMLSPRSFVPPYDWAPDDRDD